MDESKDKPDTYARGMGAVQCLRKALDDSGVHGAIRADIIGYFCNAWNQTLPGAVPESGLTGETPRTDEVYSLMPRTCDTEGDAAMCKRLGDHARKLERELGQVHTLLEGHEAWDRQHSMDVLVTHDKYEYFLACEAECNLRKSAPLSAKQPTAVVIELAMKALHEAEAILGGEYGDQYSDLCETMMGLESALRAAPLSATGFTTKGE